MSEATKPLQLLLTEILFTGQNHNPLLVDQEHGHLNNSQHHSKGRNGIKKIKLFLQLELYSEVKWMLCPHFPPDTKNPHHLQEQINNKDKTPN